MPTPTLALLALLASPTNLAESTAPVPTKRHEWMLVIAPSFDYAYGLGPEAERAFGGGFRFGGYATLWIGAKEQFFVGGGPVMYYSHLRDPRAGYEINMLTFHADLLLGGGDEDFGVFWHLTAGNGYLEFDMPTSDLLGEPFGFRTATGVGGFGKVHDRVSLGALADFGWAGGYSGGGDWNSLWVNVLLTAQLHFDRDPI